MLNIYLANLVLCLLLYSENIILFLILSIFLDIVSQSFLGLHAVIFILCKRLVENDLSFNQGLALFLFMNYVLFFIREIQNAVFYGYIDFNITLFNNLELLICATIFTCINQLKKVFI